MERLNALLNCMIILVLVLLSARSSMAAVLYADLAIYNGKILTADTPNPESFTIAQAAAVHKGEFTVVGTMVRTGFASLIIRTTGIGKSIKRRPSPSSGLRASTPAGTGRWTCPANCWRR